MSKHKLRISGPRPGHPMVHCMWLTKGKLGVFTRSTARGQGWKRVYAHTDLGDVIVNAGERAYGRVIGS